MALIVVLAVLGLVLCSCGDRREAAPTESEEPASPAASESAGESGESGESADEDSPGDDTAGEEAQPDSDISGAVRNERAVFWLGDNRLLAHRRQGGGLYIDAGSAGFAKYLRFGLPTLRWQLRGERDGIPVALPSRLAAVEVPLSASEAIASNHLIMRIHAPSARRMTIKINGRPPGDERGASSVELSEGWQTVTVPLGPQRLRPGENFIALSGSRNPAIGLAWLYLGPQDTAEDRPPFYQRAGDR
ncbi:MAG: hypothetical protein AAGC55_32395, partial [Myxococcota bacterium]